MKGPTDRPNLRFFWELWAPPSEGKDSYSTTLNRRSLWAADRYLVMERRVYQAANYARQTPFVSLSVVHARLCVRDLLCPGQTRRAGAKTSRGANAAGPAGTEL